MTIHSLSNLGFLSKVIEKVVDASLSAHISSNRLLPLFQSVYRKYQSLYWDSRYLHSQWHDQSHRPRQRRCSCVIRPVRGLRHGRPLCPHRCDENTRREMLSGGWPTF